MKKKTAHKSDRLLRREEVINLTGLSSATIWRLGESGDFPKGRRLSQSAVGWLESEVQAWIYSRPEATLSNCTPRFKNKKPGI